MFPAAPRKRRLDRTATDGAAHRRSVLRRGPSPARGHSSRRLGCIWDRRHRAKRGAVPRRVARISHRAGRRPCLPLRQRQRRDLDRLIERYVNHGLVTRSIGRSRAVRLEAYSHALRFFGPSVDGWRSSMSTSSSCRSWTTTSRRGSLASPTLPTSASLGWSSGSRAIAPPGGLTIDSYTGVADIFGRDPSLPPRVKTIVQSRSVSAVGIHTATVADVPIARDERPVPTRSVRTGARGLAQVNHYYTRSFEEFEAKRFSGTATGDLRRARRSPSTCPSCGRT